MPSGAVSVARSEVQAVATQVLAALDQVWPGGRQLLAQDPEAAVELWGQVRVRRVPADETSKGCSVAGAYVWDEVPPVLAVARSTSTGRQRFTLLHELGHHLQQTDVGLAQVLADAGVRSRTLEEAACDAFAAAVLLPEEKVQRIIPREGPTVSSIADLRRDSGASRAAVCVRAAQRLTSPGQVLLLEYDGTVQFASAHGVPPVARGSSQADAPVIQDALGSAGGIRKGQTRLLYRDGIRGQELFAQAGELDGYLVVVTMVDRPPWEDRFVLPSRETGPSARTWLCEQPGCNAEFQSFEPTCSKCRAPECPECGLCACVSRVKTRVCKNCFTEYSLVCFNGDATVCNECT